jgi:putative flippase GtrA
VKRLAGEGLRFLVTGVVNTLVSYAVYFVLQLAMPYQAAYAIAFLVGVATSYLLNVKFVFRVEHTRAKALVFPLVYVAQYALGAALLALLVERAGIPQAWAPLLVTVVMIPVTFALSRLVMRGRRAP